MRRFTALRNALGLGLAAGLAITCVVLITIPNDVELLYKKMTQQEAYQTAKALQRSRAVHSRGDAAKTARGETMRKTQPAQNSATDATQYLVGDRAMESMEQRDQLLQPHWDEQTPRLLPSVHHANPRNTVADFMRELDVPEQYRSPLQQLKQQQLFSIMERSPPGHGTGANDDPFLNLNPPLNPAISAEGHHGEFDPYSDRDPPIYKKSDLSILRALPMMQMARQKSQGPLPGFIPTYKVGGDPLPGFIPTFKAPARRQAAYNSLAHYDTWVPNADAASSFYPVAHTHVEDAGMGTNNAFLGSSDGAHTGWSTARAPLNMDKSLAKLKNALDQQLHYVSTGAGNAEAGAIFDDINDGPHGANNHHLHKVAKHTPKDKSATQSLHYVSDKAGAAGVNAIFDGIADSEHGANNHHLHKVTEHMGSLNEKFDAFFTPKD